MDLIHLHPNRFYQPTNTLLAMSSVRTTPGSRSVFVADNGHAEITRFVNDQYPASRIDPTRPYPTGYEVFKMSIAVLTG